MVFLNDPPRTRRGHPDWTIEGQDWPHRNISKFVQTGGQTWHLQRMGSGPQALLLHGTGASTHSWADLLPRLAETFDTLAIDLPGHGFTQMRPGFVPSLPNVTDAVGQLLSEIDVQPDIIIGHSAGAAIALCLGERLQPAPERIVSLNGALHPFDGAMGIIAPLTAKLVTIGGLAARALASSARDIGRVERLLYDTGSMPPQAYIAHYATLLRCRGHVQGTLEMMANWNLGPMETICAGLAMPILFVAGSKDSTVPPDAARSMADIAPEGRFLCLDRVGHLAHEEAPQRIADVILDNDTWDNAPLRSAD
ncbi:MAG: alpha/beta fold hydrolase BchO [Pseudomonadota bacterium]